MFGARHHAQPARPAGVARRRVRRLTPVRPALQAPEERQRTEVLVVDAAYFEDPVRAHGDAVRLALAAVAIDHGNVGAGLRAALLAGALGAACRPARLVLVETRRGAALGGQAVVVWVGAHGVAP